jgi:glycosyltransferase involved in cell wall biosynthesis
MEISIVIPVYNEEKNIVPLYKEVKPILNSLNKDYEIIFVDDGSKDKTLEELKKIHEKDKSIKIIKFRKNFGQTAALDAGFKHASGKIIVAMDADLQNDPNDIPKLLEKINQRYDVVSGWRKKRRDSLIKHLISRAANVLRFLIINDKIHDSGCTLKAYKKECFKDLDLYGEMHRFIPALLRWKGFKITEVVVNHRKRKFGKTKYSITRVLKGFLDMLVVKFWMQYSTRPVHLFGGLGIVSGFLGFVIALYLTILKLFYNIPIGNRPLLFLSGLLIIIGVQFVIFGFLADIMIKIYYSKEKIKPYNIEKIIE